MSEPITDHAYRPDRQGQWQTGRCDLCGEPRAAHADGCANCGHPIAWHDSEDDDMCAHTTCYCQQPS